MIILGLGCNVGDRLANLREALTQLQVCSDLIVHQVSPVYESDALLPENASPSWDTPYLNLALSISTKLNPEQLVIKTKTIEEKMGRLQHLHWSPRVIDIDLLAWHDESYHTSKLDVPHRDLLERPFALWPLADLIPDWQYCEPNKTATGKTAKELEQKFGSRFAGKGPLHTKQIAQRVDTPMLMGILNLTPDSFSDGGKFVAIEKVLLRVKDLFNAGAEIIDIGAESTRPVGAVKITVAEEWRRLQPILDAWQTLWVNKTFRPKLSVDSCKPEIVEKLLSYKIDFLNDVSGLTQPKMLEVIKASEAKIIFMHNLGIPANPKNVLALDVDAVNVVFRWGQEQLEKIIKAGVSRERLIFDVGIGFGKTAQQSLDIIKNISRFHALGIPLLVGHSRKSFLNLFTELPFVERDIETAVFSNFLATQKVDYLRVHEVGINARCLKLSAVIR